MNRIYHLRSACSRRLPGDREPPRLKPHVSARHRRPGIGKRNPRSDHISVVKSPSKRPRYGKLHIDEAGNSSKSSVLLSAGRQLSDHANRKLAVGLPLRAVLVVRDVEQQLQHDLFELAGHFKVHRPL